jgi:hypothetical protein
VAFVGPEGAAGFVGEGVADKATVAEAKGRHMQIDSNTALFGAMPGFAV